jgi:hypothetical protein
MITELIARLTRPCTGITRLVSESMDRTLPLCARLELRLHLLICSGCAEYRRQLYLIRRTMRRPSGSAPAALQASPTLSPEARSKLSDTFSSRVKDR